MSLAGRLRELRDKITTFEVNTGQCYFDSDDLETLEQAISVTDNYNDTEHVMQLEDDLNTLAEDWNVVVAEEGLEEAKNQYMDLVEQLRLFKEDVPILYPDGEPISE